MAEEEVSYASIVLKSKKHPQSEVKNENETVYDEVKVDKEPVQAKTVEDATYAEVQEQNERVQQTSDTTGLLSDKAAVRCRRYQQLASCFGILCVILVLSIIGVCVYFATVRESAAKELNQMKSHQKVLLEENHNLTDLNNKLSLDYQNLTVQFNNLTAENYNLTNLNNKLSLDYQNLTVQFNNLTAVSTALKNKTTTLTAENHNLTNLNNKLSLDYQNLTVQFNNLTAENYNLTSLNKGLRKERENLTELIRNMEKTWNELNVSRAQWSIDAYCRKTSGVRSCTSCQHGWNHQSPSCYAYNDFQPPGQRTWEGARENCRTKISDLPVVSNQAEKDYVNSISQSDNGIQGYWIGLRAEEGKWKWIDGSVLTNQSWMQQNATDGQCVTSLQYREWRSVSCTDKNAWICEKKALSV